MSFKGRVTTLMLVTLIIVYGWYFIQVLFAASTTPVEQIAYQALMFIVVVVLVVLAIAGITVVASLAPNDSDEEDERDRLIEMRGDQVGGYMLAVGALFALGMVMVEVEYFWIANTLLAGLVLSQIGKAALMVIVYRRGY
jgi:hypothetical protein